LFAYRNSVHSSTNETPFLFGSFGKDPQMIDDLKEREEMTVEEYKKVMVEKLRKIYHEVQYFNNIIQQKKRKNGK
jgi:hypothetical protein